MMMIMSGSQGRLHCVLEISHLSTCRIVTVVLLKVADGKMEGRKTTVSTQ